jgi:hypothetical protein
MKTFGSYLKKYGFNGTKFQQGDVVMFKVDKLPTRGRTIKKLSSGGVVQHGEVTGHAHRLDLQSKFTMYESSEPLSFTDELTGGTIAVKLKYLNVNEPTALSHEEHQTITLPTGQYVVGIVQEYDYDTEEARSVLD